MPKHVCTSEPLSQHVSINTMNNTCENVWLSPKKRLKYFAQIKSFSYHITLSFPFLPCVLTACEEFGSLTKSLNRWGEGVTVPSLMSR